MAASIEALRAGLGYAVSVVGRPTPDTRVYRLQSNASHKGTMAFQTRKQTTVTVTDCPEQMMCSRLQCQQTWLPCRHVLWMNNCTVVVGDCGARWLRRVYLGDLDKEWFAIAPFNSLDWFSVAVHVELPVIHVDEPTAAAAASVDVQPPTASAQADAADTSELVSRFSFTAAVSTAQDAASAKQLFHDFLHEAKRSPSLMAATLQTLSRLLEDGVAARNKGQPGALHIDSLRPHGASRGKPAWERYG